MVLDGALACEWLGWCWMEVAKCEWLGWWGWCWMVVETSKVWQLWLVDGWRMQAELHKPTFTN